MATRKKTAKKTTTKKTAASLPQAADIPEGMQQIGGGYAPAWDVEQRPVIHGPVTAGVRDVEIKRGKKVIETRVMEVTDKNDGERFAVWESAALGDLFDLVAENGEGIEVYLRFEGYGKKKAGQNPPKLFTVAAAA